MDNDKIKAILDNLGQFNDELDLEEYQIITLNNYNEQFKNKIVNSNITLSKDEEIFQNEINNISVSINENKATYASSIEDVTKINETILSGKLLENREEYEQEIKDLNEEINEVSDEFEKELTSISSTTYYKKLDIVQTNKEYSDNLEDIKKNYIKSLQFHLDKKEEKLNELLDPINNSNLELEENLKTIKSLHDNIDVYENEENEIEKQNINNKLDDNEKSIYNQKIDMNSQIELISEKFKLQLTRYVTPLKNHIDFLNNEIKDLQNGLSTAEVKCLDTFKLNLEIIDKQLEIQKLKATNRQKEIKHLLSIEDSSSLRLESAKIENEVNVFNESMRAKRIEYDLKKNFEIHSLNLTYNANLSILEKKIELTQMRLKTLETISSYNEYIQLGQLRHEMDIKEVRVKNEIDNLKQKRYLLDSLEKLEKEYFSNIHQYQVEIHGKSVEYNSKYYESVKDNINTLTNLEIEKNLILKNHNIVLNELLVKKLDFSSKIINLDEKNQIQLKKLSNTHKKRILSQDIQFANKKLELMKKLNTLEKDYNIQKYINKNNYELEVKTYNIFENRFSIEKSLYKTYFENIKFKIETVELFYNKYNQVTNCKNKNIAFSTFEYVTSLLKNEVISLLNKIINVISNRITFEGTINFQYELNRLTAEKEQNELGYSANLERFDETISNYESTIVLYTEKIDMLEKESDKTKNQLIIKDLELAKTDVKFSTTIEKITSEIEILEENEIEYRKEIKTYLELINKNRKMIIDLNKTVPNLKKKYNKTAASLAHQLSTIEKRHKQESSVYYNFISKIEVLTNDINLNFSNEETDNVYTYFKKYTSSIYASISNFQTYDIDVLFNKLSNRHESSLSAAENKYSELVDETKAIYNLDIKRISQSYSEQLFEIEKRIEKLDYQYKFSKKECVANHKDKVHNVKQQIREIDIELNKIKANLLYDINSFTENIDQHKILTNNTIDKIKNDRTNLTNLYFKHNESLNTEKIEKIKNLEKRSNTLILSLKNTYDNIIEEKHSKYLERENTYKARIIDAEKVLATYIEQFDLTIGYFSIDENIKLKNLEKKLEIDLYSLKKSSLNKINKENKRFSKISKL